MFKNDRHHLKSLDIYVIAWEHCPMLHKNTYKILIGIGILIAIDVLTHKLWAVLLYVSIWSLLLFRQSKISIRGKGIVSPVTGIVSQITKTEVDGKELVTICINTRPILDPQNFKAMPADKIISLKMDAQNQLVNYESGLSVIHAPFFGLASLDLDDTSNLNYNAEDNNYGYSLLGCKTTIRLPENTVNYVTQGQKVIVGESIIGGPAC